MATVGDVGSVNAESLYQHSFGTLKHKTRYYDVDNNIDLRTQEQFLGRAYDAGLKAMNVSGMAAGTTDKAIIPIYLDPKIIDTSRKFTPLVEIMPRVSNQGITADYTNLSKGSAFVAAEDAALNEVNDTYTRVSVPIKYLYAIGRITGPTLAAVPSFLMAGITASGGSPQGSFGDSNAPNGMQLEVLSKTRAIKELEENLIINGDAATAPLQFSGIIKLMGATNTKDKSTSALTLADINTAIRYAFDDGGRPNIAVCSSGVYEDLQNLIQQKFGYMNAEKQIYWGFTALTLRTMVGEIPIIPSMFMSNVSGSKAIYFLDLSVCEVRVLQDLTYEKLAKTNDSDKFMLKMYECFIIKNPAFCSSVTGISG
jgi:hypothetical protein